MPTTKKKILLVASAAGLAIITSILPYLINEALNGSTRTIQLANGTQITEKCDRGSDYYICNYYNNGKLVFPNFNEIKETEN